MVSKLQEWIEEFLRLESAAGIVLMFAALAAMLVANSPLAGFYDLLISTPVEVRVGNLEIAKPLLLWINDGLMVFFFFMVGLELKRELVEGELSSLDKLSLPLAGALGGIVVPGLIYAWFNAGDSVAMQGWAIPTATDIAFALGILSLLGSRIPLSVKVFLTSLAIFDDIAAIVIIALFYTANISLYSLLIVLLCLPVLLWLNRRPGTTSFPFVVVGVVMWVAMLKSGVHATLTGVILALFIPIQRDAQGGPCMLKTLEHALHHKVAFFVLPIFAFANAGITLLGITAEQVLHSVPMGIASGLVVGKLIGIFVFASIAVVFGLSRLPKDMNYKALLGTSALCGVGFTMSLFIGSLAFEETGVNLLFDERLGIIIGSLLSGVLGYLILRGSYPVRESEKRGGTKREGTDNFVT